MKHFPFHILMSLLLWGYVGCCTSLSAQTVSNEDEEPAVEYLHGIESKLVFDEQMLRDFQAYALEKGVLHKPVQAAPAQTKEKSKARPADESVKAEDEADSKKSFKVLRQRYMLFAFLLVLVALYYGNKLRTFGKEEEDPYHHGEDRKPRSLLSYLLPLFAVIMLLSADLYFLYMLTQSNKPQEETPSTVKPEDFKSKYPGLRRLEDSSSKYYGQVSGDRPSLRSGLGHRRTTSIGYDYFGYWEKDLRHGLGRTYWKPDRYCIGEYNKDQEEGCAVFRNGNDMWYGRIEKSCMRIGYGIHYWTDTNTIELAYYMGWNIQTILCLPDPQASKGGKKQKIRATYRLGDNIYITQPKADIDINEFICQCLTSARQAEHGVAVLDSVMDGFPGYKPLASFNRIRLTDRVVKALSEGM